MKHAGPAALARLESLLAELRRRSELVERRPGVFYRRGRAFLHFHEDPQGLFADLRIAENWERLPVHDPTDQAVLLATIERSATGTV